jgi:hypothetical protein
VTARSAIQRNYAQTSLPKHRLRATRGVEASEMQDIGVADEAS